MADKRRRLVLQVQPELQAAIADAAAAKCQSRAEYCRGAIRTALKADGCAPPVKASGNKLTGAQLLRLDAEQRHLIDAALALARDDL